MSRRVIILLCAIAGLCLAGCGDDDGTRPPPREPRALIVKADGMGEFPNIQAAVAAAIDGDTIMLDSGTFSGPGNRDVDYSGKRIVIRSMTGHPSSVTIDCVPDEGSDNNHRGFYFHSGEGPAAVLEGLTIINGSATGGGVRVDSSSSPTIRNVVFRENSALGLYCWGSSPIVERCIFTRNSPRGAMECYAESAPVVRYCQFVRNYSDYGGAGFASYLSAPVLAHCVFWDNQSKLGGGGAQIGISSETALGEFSISYCVFSDNIAGSFGGGLLIGGTDGTVSDCVFRSNWASRGGGLYVGQNVTAAIDHSTIVTNYASKGAGIWLYSGATVTIGNTIIAFNNQGAAVECDSEFSISEATLTCCDVYGNAGGNWVDCLQGQLSRNKNVSADPLFCDMDSGNLLLHADSPCINDSCGVIGMYGVGCGL
ncbi:MAG: right-handed parallel beta-helix repeat-containing protein [Candidatus Latescibacterota bacterium]|nr:MAG: right-handed parallel beta-helix repeat-containing protein [Candidatus Latescibacterota bacterium]